MYCVLYTRLSQIDGRFNLAVITDCVDRIWLIDPSVLVRVILPGGVLWNTRSHVRLELKVLEVSRGFDL